LTGKRCEGAKVGDPRLGLARKPQRAVEPVDLAAGQQRKPPAAQLQQQHADRRAAFPVDLGPAVEPVADGLRKPRLGKADTGGGHVEGGADAVRPRLTPDPPVTRQLQIACGDVGALKAADGEGTSPAVARRRVECQVDRGLADPRGRPGEGQAHGRAAGVGDTAGEPKALGQPVGRDLGAARQRQMRRLYPERVELRRPLRAPRPGGIDRDCRAEEVAVFRRDERGHVTRHVQLEARHPRQVSDLAQCQLPGKPLHAVGRQPEIGGEIRKRPVARDVEIQRRRSGQVDQRGQDTARRLFGGQLKPQLPRGVVEGARKRDAPAGRIEPCDIEPRPARAIRERRVALERQHRRLPQHIGTQFRPRDG
jgi:hypothetical protein